MRLLPDRRQGGPLRPRPRLTMRAGDRATYRLGFHRKTRVEVIEPAGNIYGITGHRRVLVVGRSRKSTALAYDHTAWVEPQTLTPRWPRCWWRRYP